MNTIVIYLIQLIVTLVICLGLTTYLRPHLWRVLVDLCGTEERAQFWTVFANIMLIVVPLIFGLGFRPEAVVSAEAQFFQIAEQLRNNLLGFIFSFVGIAVAVGFFALVAPRTPAPTKKETK